MQTVRIGFMEIGAGRPRIIVPLTASTLDDLMDEAAALGDLPADLAEWRIDMLNEVIIQTPEGPAPDIPYILSVLSGVGTVNPVSLIAAFRTADEGGIAISDKGYEDLCRALIDSGSVDVLDVEAFHRSGRAKAIIDYAHSRGVKIIASWHDFQSTPAKEEIVRRLVFMQDELGADIAKVAVMPQSRADVLTLMVATEEFTATQAKRPVITMSMGELGVVSRVCGQLFGSAATFGSAGRPSAPGQMEVRELASVLKVLSS